MAATSIVFIPIICGDPEREGVDRSEPGTAVEADSVRRRARSLPEREGCRRSSAS